MTKEAFEIYVMKEGHWALHGRFEKKTQDEVIETAKASLSKDGITAVKLMKEATDPETGLKTNAIIYHASNDRPVRALDAVSDLSLAVMRERRRGFRFQRPSQKKNQTAWEKIVSFLENPFAHKRAAGKDTHDDAETVIGLDEDFKKLAAGNYESVEKGAMSAGSDEELVVELTTIAMDFITISLAYLRKVSHTQITADGTFSNEDRLGINLFLAGACHYLAKRRKLNRAYLSWLIEKSLILMTNDPELAVQFSDNYKKLLGTPRNMQMFRAGAEVLKDKVIGARYTGEGLANALTTWAGEGSVSARSVKAKGLQVFAIYTQIAERGNVATQQHVRLANFSSATAHNEIVRNIIRENNGTEELHTGGGMIISFLQGADALRAAIDIQTEIITHNLHEPKNAIDVRIWISLTAKAALLQEPASLAGNVLKFAEPSQVLVSQSAAEATENTNFRVRPFAAREIKGEQVPLYVLDYARKGRLSHQDKEESVA
ncbi:MAG: hypothetical protein ACTSXQ_00120 [Alphaproteobacteria bacterium]